MEEGGGGAREKQSKGIRKGVTIVKDREEERLEVELGRREKGKKSGMKVDEGEEAKNERLAKGYGEVKGDRNGREERERKKGKKGRVIRGKVL